MYSGRADLRPVGFSQQEGFTFLWLILGLLILGLGTQKVFVSVAQQQLSAQMRQQARLVETYNLALQDYREASPGSKKLYPAELKDLLLDTRQIQTRRYLRKLYLDPLQPQLDPTQAWGLVRDEQGRITRVYSLQKNLRPSADAATQTMTAGAP